VVYIAGVYEWRAGATTTYYDGGAMRRSGHASDNGVFYVLADHLGTTSVIVSQAGEEVARQYHYPFGARRGSGLSGLTTKRFTGQYHEAGVAGGEGLSYYTARWYDPQVGRFVSADTLGAFCRTGGRSYRFYQTTATIKAGGVGAEISPWLDAFALIYGP